MISTNTSLQFNIPIGGTLVGVVIATDKTRLTNYSGNKQAYPVYMTITNLDKAVRRKTSAHSQILLGYLPVPTFDNFNTNTKSTASQEFFHRCMEMIIEPLIDAGKNGIEMVCADGWKRRIFPFLAIYVGDAPEKSLVTCTKQNYCPKCLVDPRCRGDPFPFDPDDHPPSRDPSFTLRVLNTVKDTGIKTATFKKSGIQTVFCPFWAKLPHTNIFTAITPDVLHELHQGVIGDHLIPWLIRLANSGSSAGSDETNQRFRAMASYCGLRNFENGITSASQMSGNEHREIERVMLGLFAGGVPPDAQRAASALIELLYLMRWHSHDTESLGALQDALDRFHQYKQIFIEHGIREHFNFPKLHALQHYVSSIRFFGSADGYNTETAERLHIDFAKHAYLGTNRRDYVAQMVVWLHRREKLANFSAYQKWLDELALPASESSMHVEDDEAGELQTAIRGPHSVYLLAKTAPDRNISVEDLELHYHAQDFLGALRQFLTHSVPPGTHIPTLSAGDKFHLFRQITIIVPGNAQTGYDVQRDRIRAVRALPASSGRGTRSESFSCTLVHVDKANRHTQGTALEGVY
jgi:hypothetical protein